MTMDTENNHENKSTDKSKMQDCKDEKVPAKKSRDKLLKSNSTIPCMG